MKKTKVKKGYGRLIGLHKKGDKVMFDENDRNDMNQGMENNNDTVPNDNNANNASPNESLNDGQYRLNHEYYKNQGTSTTNIREDSDNTYRQNQNASGTYNSAPQNFETYTSGSAEKNMNNSQGTYNYNMNTDNSHEEKKHKKHKGTNGGNGSNLAKKLGIAAATAAVFGLVAGASFEAVITLSDKFSDNKTTVSQVQLPQSTLETEENNTDNTASVIQKDDNVATTKLSTTVTDVSDVVESVMPSVVSITNLSVSQIRVPSFFGQQGGTYEQESESCGSGIIIGENDTELLIATNNHVVADASTLSVGFVDDSIVEAKVKGTDSDMDLAVIAVALEDIDEATLKMIKVAEIGSSDDLKVGEAAIAIGNALGYGQSVTTGVISAVNREVTVENITSELIQTDAAINPGNSGGALLNMQGQVIGINSVKFASAEVEGMGYAIPISNAMPIINELLTKETRNRVNASETGYIGIAGVDVSDEAASTYNMPSGVYVAQVTDGSAAQTAGIKKGDIITEFDGNSISSMEDLQDILQYYAAGTTVNIKIQTPNGGEYEEKEVSLTLGKKIS